MGDNFEKRKKNNNNFNLNIYASQMRQVILKRKEVKKKVLNSISLKLNHICFLNSCVDKELCFGEDLETRVDLGI